MPKTICEWSKKELEEQPERLFAITREPKFYCRKCGRVSNTKKALCKPKSFEEGK